MPHSKQAKKRLRQSIARRDQNRSVTSEMRTHVKRFDKAVAAGDEEQARKELPLVMKKLDKAAKRGVIHENAASRKKSRLNAKLGKGKTQE